MIQAAFKLEIRSLMSLMCAKLASVLNVVRPPTELRAMFGIVNDFTAEEEAQITQESEWAWKSATSASN
jgi:S-phase kinase-associated protein 1